MKKLTARNSTFLHNAKLMFGAPAYKRILAAAQHSEGQAWNVAREYISLDGSEATRKVMFSERYADLDTMFRAIKAEFSAEPAAIAANVSADAAPAWTPKPGMLVRFKQGIQLSGDNRDVDAIQGMGVVGKIIRRCSEVGYEWTVSFGLDGDYNAATDELEPASAPAPDAAQTAADEMERFFTMTDAQKFSELVNQADVIRKQNAKIDAQKCDLRIADDHICELEFELEAVKQMFDGYQTAARETEQQLTRERDAAQAAAAALREALRPFAEFDPRAYQQGNLDREVYAFNYTALKKGDFLRAVQVYAATAAPGEWKPMVGAKAFHILIGHNGIIERRDNDGTYHFRSSRNNISYVSSEGDFEPFDPSIEPDADDAALASARQRADDGTRLTTAQVIARSEFAPED